MNYVEFKGLRHYPIGDAQLEITEEGLRVSNLGKSGLDGVSIRTAEINNWEATFRPIEMTEEKAYNFNLIGEDGYGRIKIINEQSITFNPEEESTNALSFNSYLLPRTVTIVGKVNGETIFEQEYENPDYNPEINWWIVAVAIAIYIADSIDYSHTVIRDGEGNVTGTETTTSWNGSTWRMPDGQEVEADRFYLTSRYEFPEPLPPERAVEAKEVQILGKNLEELIITNETYERL